MIIQSKQHFQSSIHINAKTQKKMPKRFKTIIKHGKKHEWAGHMDCTLKFSYGYTFSKLVGYRLLLPFSLPSFLFTFYSFQSLLGVLCQYCLILYNFFNFNILSSLHFTTKPIDCSI